MQPITPRSHDYDAVTVRAERILLDLVLIKPLDDYGPITAEDETRIDTLAVSSGIAALVQARLASAVRSGLAQADVSLPRTQAAAQRAAIFEKLHEAESKIVFSALIEEKLDFVVFKGSHLAHEHYETSYFRERCDTDILFSKRDDALKATQILRELGYTIPETMDASLYAYEKDAYKVDVFGIPHAFDLHWKVRNDNLFGDFLTFDDLYTDNMTTVAGHMIHTPRDGQALLIACVHRLSNAAEGTADRLIWLYDIHVLAQALTGNDWAEFESLALREHVAYAAVDGLDASREKFGTDIPQHIWNKLASEAAHEHIPIDHFRDVQSKAISNIKSLPTIQKKITALLQIGFPRPSYIEQRYRTKGVSLLWGYAKHILGLLKKYAAR